MSVLGVRCSNKDYAYCIISGDKASPVVEAKNRVSYPNDFNEPEILKWFYQEMSDLLKKHKCAGVGIKKPEPQAKRSNALELRIQCEGVVALVAAQLGCNSIMRLVSASIAKNLGLKGKAKYLTTELDAGVIDNFENYTDKVKEATLVAWSCM